MDSRISDPSWDARNVSAIFVPAHDAHGGFPFLGPCPIRDLSAKACAFEVHGLVALQPGDAGTLFLKAGEVFLRVVGAEVTDTRPDGLVVRFPPAPAIRPWLGRLRDGPAERPADRPPPVPNRPPEPERRADRPRGQRRFERFWTAPNVTATFVPDAPNPQGGLAPPASGPVLDLSRGNCALAAGGPADTRPGVTGTLLLQAGKASLRIGGAQVRRRWASGVAVAFPETPAAEQWCLDLRRPAGTVRPDDGPADLLAQAVADRGILETELQDLRRDDRISLGLLVPLVLAVLYVASTAETFALPAHLRAPVRLFVAAVIVLLFVLHASRAYAIHKREAFLDLLKHRIGTGDFRAGYTRWAVAARSLAARVRQGAPGTTVSCARWARRQMKLGRRRGRDRHDPWTASRALHVLALPVAGWLAAGCVDLAWPADRRAALIAVLAGVLAATALLYLAYDLWARRGRHSRTFYLYAYLAVLASGAACRPAAERS